MNQTVIPPDLDDVLAELKNEIFATLNCIQIGKIESINKDEQSAEIQIQVRRRVQDGTTVAYPLLVDCPFFVLQGGGAYLDMPIAAGDFCLVLFSDRDIDTWWSSNNAKEPRTLRKHSLSDGFALIGINPKTDVLDFDGSKVRILGTSGPGSEQPAARENDPTISSSSEDSAFWSFFSAFFGVITGPVINEPGNGNPSALQAALAAAIAGAGGTPTSQSGKIETGSTEVEIG